MDSYKIKIKKSAEKEIIKVPQPDRSRVVKKIILLHSDPRPIGCEKLQGDINYRIRQGDYRVVYEVDDSEKIVHIVRVGHRREVYR